MLHEEILEFYKRDGKKWLPVKNKWRRQKQSVSKIDISQGQLCSVDFWATDSNFILNG